MNPFTARCVKDEEYRCLISGTVALVPLVVGVIHGRIYLATTNTPARMVLVAGSTQEEVLMQGTFAAVEPVWEDETGQEFNLVDLTRPGSPAGVAEFADLAQPGQQPLHADSRGSGAGEWPVLAKCGSEWQRSTDPATVQARLVTIWRNVRLLGPLAQATLTLAELDTGDGLVTCEHDTWLAPGRDVLLAIVALVASLQQAAGGCVAGGNRTVPRPGIAPQVAG